MKGDHRKELQTNILADRMGRFMTDMRTAPQSRSAGIITLIVLAVCTYIAWQFTMSRSSGSNLWASLDEDVVAQSVGEQETAQLDRTLRVVADGAPYSVVGRTASFQRARLWLSTGMSRLYSPQHSEAAKDLVKARDLYRTLADQSRDEPLLAQEALMGVAQAEEALVGVPAATEDAPPIGAKTKTDESIKSMGSLDKAAADYRALAAKFPGSYLGQQAAARLKKIEENRKDIEQFYAEMRKQAANRPVFGLPPADGLHPGDI